MYSDQCVVIDCMHFQGVVVLTLVVCCPNGHYNLQ